MWCKISKKYIINNNMVIQNRLKGSSHNQAHKIRKGLIPDGNGNEIGGYLIIIPIKFQALGKSVIHRKK